MNPLRKIFNGLTNSGDRRHRDIRTGLRGSQAKGADISPSIYGAKAGTAENQKRMNSRQTQTLDLIKNTLDAEARQTDESGMLDFLGSIQDEIEARIEKLFEAEKK